MTEDINEAYLDVDVCAGFQQQLHHVQPAVGDRQHQGRLAVLPTYRDSHVRCRRTNMDGDRQQKVATNEGTPGSAIRLSGDLPWGTVHFNRSVD